MIKFTIKDTEKHMVELYEVEAATKQEALDKYENQLAGSLEIKDSYYDPDGKDSIKVLDHIHYA